MIALLIWVAVLCMVFGLAVWIMQQLPIPQPFASIALAVLGLVFVLILLSMLLPLPPPLWHYSLR